MRVWLCDLRATAVRVRPPHSLQRGRGASSWEHRAAVRSPSCRENQGPPPHAGDHCSKQGTCKCESRSIGGLLTPLLGAGVRSADRFERVRVAGLARRDDDWSSDRRRHASRHVSDGGRPSSLDGAAFDEDNEMLVQILDNELGYSVEPRDVEFQGLELRVRARLARSSSGSGSSHPCGWTSAADTFGETALRWRSGPTSS